ncbi:MAG: hypothetical protein COA94_08585 [Rickettsiales bacterium]|nr:MAG: hypothetical protein COA94_08585 [Rickettsiales bacterium]
MSGAQIALRQQNFLDSMRDLYQAGTNHYHEGKMDEAEQYFAQALKPVFSRYLMADSPFNIEDIKEEIFAIIYRLGKTYLHFNNNSSDHYLKTAAIFQYCSAFVKKHDMDSNISGVHLSSDDYPRYLSNIACFLEKQLLHTLCQEDITATLPRDYFYTNHPQRITRYKAGLEQVRLITKKELESISSIENISERAKRVEELYKNIATFFVDESNKGFIQQLLDECFDDLGQLPNGCEYAISAMGSLSLGTMTPWSDLEFIILINEDNEGYKEYFRKFTVLLNMKVILLGETFLAAAGIKILNDYKSENPSDICFFDNVTKGGFCFDGPVWYACKTPLGRQGYSNHLDYELILTPRQMFEFQSDSWFESDRHLVQALRSVSLIASSADGKKLFDDYRSLLRDMTAEKHCSLQARSLQLLQEDVGKFSLKITEEEEGSPLRVKQDIYRIVDRVIVALFNYYNLMPDNDQPALTIWQMVDRMVNETIIPYQAGQYLKEALSIAAELRLEVYSEKNAQNEMIPDSILLDTKLLHHFYCIILNMQDVIEYVVSGQDSGELVFFDDSHYIKGQVHARFQEYEEAFREMRLAFNTMCIPQKTAPEICYIVQNLVLLSSKIKDPKTALSMIDIQSFQHIDLRDFVTNSDAFYHLMLFEQLADLGSLFFRCNMHAEELIIYKICWLLSNQYVYCNPDFHGTIKTNLLGMIKELANTDNHSVYAQEAIYCIANFQFILSKLYYSNGQYAESISRANQALQIFARLGGDLSAFDVDKIHYKLEAIYYCLENDAELKSLGDTQTVGDDWLHE